jgi:hypothetical protein
MVKAIRVLVRKSPLFLLYGTRVSFPLIEQFIAALLNSAAGGGRERQSHGLQGSRTRPGDQP